MVGIFWAMAPNGTWLVVSFGWVQVDGRMEVVACSTTGVEAGPFLPPRSPYSVGASCLPCVGLHRDGGSCPTNRLPFHFCGPASPCLALPRLSLNESCRYPRPFPPCRVHLVESMSGSGRNARRMPSTSFPPPPLPAQLLLSPGALISDLLRRRQGREGTPHDGETQHTHTPTLIPPRVVRRVFVLPSSRHLA
ncbi:hypothetical protein B0T11DRAFT_90752 [Plectosphaerella cucumerina]|uniref:Secreted protein n=1 Tax=Plectosphaerella cucumerina TaxID=40658 RepID=A0A8K0TGN0_9PEZI|nr:hypothetical protein B0T11DRAFT_90752 [Plectosphaerella cucumerina]